MALLRTMPGLVRGLLNSTVRDCRGVINEVGHRFRPWHRV